MPAWNNLFYQEKKQKQNSIIESEQKINVQAPKFSPLSDLLKYYHV